MSFKHWGMILSAGFGTRLKPLTDFLPKPQLELYGKPIIFHVLDQLKAVGIKDVIINLHYKAQSLSHILEKYEGLRLHLLYEKEILGTAGAVINAVKKFNLENQDLIVMHADILCELDLKSLLYENNFCTLLCSENQQIKGYTGNVYADKNGFITQLGQFLSLDKPHSKNGFFTGVQVLSKEALKMLVKTQAFSLVKDVYTKWIQQNLNIRAVMKNFYYNDLGSIERLFETNMYYLKRQTKNIHVPSKTMAKNVTIINPVYILDNVQINDGAQIGPFVIIGENSVIESDTKIKNTVIMSNTLIKKSENLNFSFALDTCRVSVKNF